jgi:hypothetical protein
MALHRYARLGLAGRRALVADVERACSCRKAARRRGVSPTTACNALRRRLLEKHSCAGSLRPVGHERVRAHGDRAVAAVAT